MQTEHKTTAHSSEATPGRVEFCRSQRTTARFCEGESMTKVHPFVAAVCRSITASNCRAASGASGSNPSTNWRSSVALAC